MGFDFLGVDVDLQVCLQRGLQLNPGRYSLDSNGNRVQNPEDPDVVKVGLRSQLGVRPGTSEIVLAPESDTEDRFPLDFFRSMMTRFQMEIGLSLIPKVEVDIEPPGNDMALALLNSNVFAFGNILAVKFGYSRSPFEVFPGRGNEAELFMLLKPDVKFGDTISFTLRGLGGLAAAQRAQRTEDYLKLTPREVVSRIALRNGLTMQEPDFGVPPPEASVFGQEISPLKSKEQIAWETAKDWQQINQTDWDFLNAVLESLPGKFTFRVEGDRLLIGVQGILLAQAPKAVFRWYHAPRFDASTGQQAGTMTPCDEFPIFKFESDTTLTFFPASAAGVVLNSGLGRDARQSSATGAAAIPGQVEVNAKTSTDQRRLAPTANTSGLNSEDIRCGSQRAKPFGALQGNPGGMRLTQSNAATEPSFALNVLETVRNLEQEAQFYGNWTATIETIGIPTLRPGDLVLLRGFETIGTVTEKLNGLFLVKKIVHTIGADGYVSEISLLRNATPGEGVRVANFNPKDKPELCQPRATVFRRAVPATD